MKKQLTLSDAICGSVKENLVKFVCSDCATKHRKHEPYDGTYTAHIGSCEICGKEKQITSAKKLFGYHIFV